jgi:crossover junction endodeoxyribonuclease RuvC
VIILGIDPGYATVGWGVIKSEKGRHSAVGYGVITTPKTQPMPDRLVYIGNELSKLIETHKPDAVAVEELFFHTNQKTVITVAQARGVIIYVAQGLGARLYEYTPLQIKQALTGYGRAEKQQMQIMVKTILCLKEIPKPDDAADALAVALTHAQTNTLLGNTRI